MKTIARDDYLQQLIDRKHNGLVKIVTGIRRCGKSYLLFTLFKQHSIPPRMRGIHQQKNFHSSLSTDHPRVCRANS